MKALMFYFFIFILGGSMLSCNSATTEELNNEPEYLRCNYLKKSVINK